MDQPSVSHDGFVFGEFEEIGPSAKRKEVTKNIKKRRNARELALKFKAKVLEKRKEKDPIYRQALNKFDTSIKAKEEQIEKIKRDIEALRNQKAAKEANQLAEQKGWRERRFAAESELRNLHFEITKLQKEIAQEELEEVLNAAKLKEEAEKIKAAKRRAKELAKQAERDEKLAKRKADREERDKERQELRDKEREAKKKKQDAEREKKRAQELQKRIFNKKYKGKVFYFENPDQVEDTRRLRPIEKPTSYLQSFTNFFSSGSGKFYYLEGERQYDFDVSALKQIAEPILNSINQSTQKDDPLVSDAPSFDEFKSKFLIPNGYFMSMEGLSIKNPKKFAIGMDKVFYNDVRAGINQNLTAKGTYKERWGVALKEGEVRRLTFTKKKEKIVDESAMEEDDQDDEYSVYEKKHDLLVNSSDEESDSDSDGERVGFVDDDDDNMGDIESNISSALDLIKI